MRARVNAAQGALFELAGRGAQRQLVQDREVFACKQAGCRNGYRYTYRHSTRTYQRVICEACQGTGTHA